MWYNTRGAYFLDAGPYDHEQEVLFSYYDCLRVKSVEEIKDEQQVAYTLITL